MLSVGMFNLKLIATMVSNLYFRGPEDFSFARGAGEAFQGEAQVAEGLFHYSFHAVGDEYASRFEGNFAENKVGELVDEIYKRLGLLSISVYNPSSSKCFNA